MRITQNHGLWIGAFVLAGCGSSHSTGSGGTGGLPGGGAGGGVGAGGMGIAGGGGVGIELAVGGVGASDDPTGDEEYVTVIPAPQYLDKYVFFTDPTYATTNLVLVRSKGASGFAPVNVDCLGAVSVWRDIGTQGRYQMADVDLVRNNVPNGACENGHHVAESKQPFGLIVWGLDHFASYAYPAGSGAAQLNEVVVTPVVK